MRKLALALLGGIVLAACQGDSLAFYPIVAPPGGMDLTSLGLGTAAYVEVTDSHPEIEGETTFAFDSIVSDDPTVVRVMVDKGGWIFIGAGLGETTLHLHANSSWDVPVRVVAQP